MFSKLSFRNFGKKIRVFKNIVKEPVYCSFYVRLSSSSSESSKKYNHVDYCIELVRKKDYENYLCTLLLPNTIRTEAFALRAFNVELAQIRDQVSDRLAGLGRVQFWKDALEQIYKGKPLATPVSQNLAMIVVKYNLSKVWLLRLIEAREQNLLHNTNNQLKDIEDYGEKSTSSVNYLLLQMLGIKNIHADHVASHLGKAQFITSVIRAIPHSIQKNNVIVPIDLMIKHKVSQEEILRGCREQKMKDLIYDFACAAHSHISTARSLKKELPPLSLPVFLTSIPSASFLDRLQKTDFNIFDPSLQRRDGLMALKLWKSRLLKII